MTRMRNGVGCVEIHEERGRSNAVSLNAIGGEPNEECLDEESGPNDVADPTSGLVAAQQRVSKRGRGDVAIHEPLPTCFHQARLVKNSLVEKGDPPEVVSLLTGSGASAEPSYAVV